MAAESDEMLTRWDATGDLSTEELLRGQRGDVHRRRLHPLLCGSALATIGIHPLLNAVGDFLPSPAEARPVFAHLADGEVDDPAEALVPDPTRPLRKLVFKVVCTAHGELGFCRVYQGMLRAGDRLWFPYRRSPERAARLVKLHCEQHTAVTEAGPGDLCAVMGIRHAATGDTLCPADYQALLRIQPIALSARDSHPVGGRLRNYHAESCHRPIQHLVHQAIGWPRNRLE